MQAPSQMTDAFPDLRLSPTPLLHSTAPLSPLRFCLNLRHQGYTEAEDTYYWHRNPPECRDCTPVSYRFPNRCIQAAGICRHFHQGYSEFPHHSDCPYLLRCLLCLRHFFRRLCRFCHLVLCQGHHFVNSVYHPDSVYHL